MNNTSESNPTDPASTPSQRHFRITVFGVGGAGCNAVNHIARVPFAGVEFFALNTDAAALGQLTLPNRMVLGEMITRGMGAGGDPERGRAAAEEDVEKLKAMCQGVDIVFIAAGMGGGTGTGGAPVLARVAREAGALVLGLLIFPFEWEGGRRQRQAQTGFRAMKEETDGVICLPNQKLFNQIDEKTSLLETFAMTHELLAQGVRGIWRMLMRPGLINVDFADLCSVTRGQHAENALATAEACGESRSREIVEKLLRHPLLEGGTVLDEATSVLISLVGGPDLTMAEVNRVMEQMNRRCENAHIILGAAVEQDFADRLAITVVASRRPPAERHENAEPAELEREVARAEETGRSASRFVAPAPPVTLQNAEKILQNGARGKRKLPKMRQGQLPLEIVSKGRFEKSEPTIHQGQDLDVPTYIRRGVPLN